MQTLKEHKEETLKDFASEFGIHFKDSAGELQFAQTFIAEALDKQIELIKELLPNEIDYTEKDLKTEMSVPETMNRMIKDTWNACLIKVKEILK